MRQTPAQCLLLSDLKVLTMFSFVASMVLQILVFKHTLIMTPYTELYSSLISLSQTFSYHDLA